MAAAPLKIYVIDPEVSGLRTAKELPARSTVTDALALVRPNLDWSAYTVTVRRGATAFTSSPDAAGGANLSSDFALHADDTVCITARSMKGQLPRATGRTH